MKSFRKPDQPRSSTTSSSRRRQNLTLGIVVAVLTTLDLPRIASAQEDERSCYYYNGTSAGDDVKPCGTSNTAHAACCHQGWACLSNGLCMAAGQDPDNLRDATIYRGGCTDQSWASPDCPSWCTDEDEIDDLGAAQSIEACPGETSGFYCLNGDSDDCDDEEDRIQFSGSPTIMTTIGASPSSSASAVTSASDSASASASASASISESLSSVASSSLSPSETAGPDAGGNASASDTSDDSTALKIGLGVGIGVGGLGLLAALVFFLLWRRRSRKAKKSAQEAEKAELAAADEKKAAEAAYEAKMHGNELPTTVSSKIVEASPDSMRVEAPGGGFSAAEKGRVEAPTNEVRPEMATNEGTQGLHELPGSDVVRGRGDEGSSSSTTGGSLSPTSPTSPTSPSSPISRKPVGK